MAALARAADMAGRAGGDHEHIRRQASVPSSTSYRWGQGVKQVGAIALSHMCFAEFVLIAERCDRELPLP